jgi:hypothetical protein
MDLNTTQPIPTEQLLAHIRAFYPQHTVGTCNDYGGEADGVTLAIDNGAVINLNIYHDDGTFGEKGWVVEEFNLIKLEPDVTPCANLGEALTTFRSKLKAWMARP